MSETTYVPAVGDRVRLTVDADADDGKYSASAGDLGTVTEVIGVPDGLEVLFSAIFGNKTPIFVEVDGKPLPATEDEDKEMQNRTDWALLSDEVEKVD
jgi:hypothetical protein